MTESRITTETTGRVLCIGLARQQKRNAFDMEMYQALAAAYRRLEDDPDLWCGVLYAHGDHFTAGLDLPKWAEAFAGGTFPGLPGDAIDPLGIYSDRTLSKPVVMAVQGICLTIGIELLLSADIRVAATDTRFGQIEIKRGIYPVGGATIRLFQEVGWGNAMRWLLTAETLAAEEALRIGLVQELTAPGKQLDRAMEIAGTIAAQAPLGVQATLKSARLARRDGELAAMARLLPDLQPLMNSRDVQEGIAAFIERREASFTGK
jgi:enoyl-CoA hydratase